MGEAITVRRAGLAAVQDLGRSGFERAGISVNGAADQYSAAVANTLVGNDERSPLIEITVTDFAFEATCPLLISVTGAPATVLVGGRAERQWEPISVAAGEPVEIGRLRDGLRVYVAVNGALEVRRVLGSCAPDSLLGVDSWLHRGSRLGISSAYRPIDHPTFRHPVFRLGAAIPKFGSPWTVDVTSGLDVDEFEDAVETLCLAEYRVSQRSNHIGLRLAGRAPVRTKTGEMLSRGVPVGAIEVPPSPELLLLLRGRPVTAGYPVVAVAGKAAQSALGQVAPGDVIRFRSRTVLELTRSAAQQRHLVHQLAHRVRVVFRELGLSSCVTTKEPSQ